MKTSLANSTRIAFLFVLFTPLLLGIVVVLELNAYQNSTERVAHTKEVLGAMDQLLLSVTRAESAQRAYLLTSDTSYLQWFARGQDESQNQLRALTRLTADNRLQQRNLQQLQDAVSARFVLMNNLIARRRKIPHLPDSLSASLESGSASMRQLWDVTHQVNMEENRLLGHRLSAERYTEAGVAASFIVCIAVNLVVLVWAYRLITKYSQARDLAASQLLQLNAELEDRVAERTAELENANDQLKRSNDDLTKFAYVASHDLQEPLRTIGSYVGLLSHRYQGKLDDQADKYIRFVVEGAKRMQNLVQDLLLYSRVGTEALKLSNVDMDTVLQHVRANLALTIREQDAAIVSTQLPKVNGDQNKLTQVLMNLVNNALKFRKPDQPPLIQIEAARRDSEWLFTVRDNGIGFDQQYAERIFAIFQRLHGVGAYPGTGMGLAISKRVIELHGGKIWAVSNSGEGAQFSFTLPVENRSNSLQPRRSPRGAKIEIEAATK